MKSWESSQMYTPSSRVAQICIHGACTEAGLDSSDPISELPCRHFRGGGLRNTRSWGCSSLTTSHGESGCRRFVPAATGSSHCVTPGSSELLLLWLCRGTPNNFTGIGCFASSNAGVEDGLEVDGKELPSCFESPFSCCGWSWRGG